MAKYLRHQAWADAKPGVTPDIVKKKADKGKQQRERASAKSAAASAASGTAVSADSAIPPPPPPPSSWDNVTVPPPPPDEEPRSSDRPLEGLKILVKVYGVKPISNGRIGSIDFWTDCAGFGDLQKDARLQEHVGLHEKIIEMVTCHQDMEDILAELAEFLSSCSPAASVTVGTFCKAKGQGSVAVSSLLSQAMFCLGADVRSVYAERKGFFGLCATCTRCMPTQRKADLAIEISDRLLASEATIRISE